MRIEDAPTMMLGLVLFLLVSVVGCRTEADPDLWGHVRFGQDILAAHSVVSYDSYAFTSDRPWINHEWLSEVLMAVAYDLGGGAGLVTLKLLLVWSTFAVAWKALRGARVSQPVSIGILLVAVPAINHMVVAVRPQLFSLLLCTVVLSLLNGISRGRVVLFLWMPAVFALWANSHGGWVVGAGIVLLWSTCGALSRTITWSWAVGGLTLSVSGSLATPYGFELWRFLWDTVGIGRSDISDWQPLIRTPSLLLPWVLIGLLPIVAWKRQGMRAVPLLIPPLALGVLALRVVRLEGLFAMTAVVLLAPCFAGLGPARLPLSRRPRRSDLAVVGVMCLLGVGGAFGATYRTAGCVMISDDDLKNPWAPEAEAIVFARVNQLEGRLLSYFDYGEMAIWHLAPRMRVSYDGRRETVYSEAIQEAHLSFYRNAHDASYANTLEADYIWLPRRLPVNGSLTRAGWVAIFDGPRSVIYARAAAPYVQPDPWSGDRCFPGP